MRIRNFQKDGQQETERQPNEGLSAGAHLSFRMKKFLIMNFVLNVFFQSVMNFVLNPFFQSGRNINKEESDQTTTKTLWMMCLVTKLFYDTVRSPAETVGNRKS
jgi:hypothetical protein